MLSPAFWQGVQVLPVSSSNMRIMANNDSIRQQALKIIDKTIDLVFEGNSYPTFCAGLAGISLFLSDLEGKKLVDTTITKEIDQFLEMAMKNEIMHDHYDFLHGAVGISYYFVSRAEKRKKYQRVVKLIVDYLDHTAQRYTEDGINLVKWKSYHHTTAAVEYNISMSHGMSSIVVLLSKILKLGIPSIRKRILPLIEGAINYILKQQIDRNTYQSFFPYSSIETATPLTGSRLAWCYGDLGVAMAIWQAGVALENENWKNKALGILSFSCQRRDLQENLLMDACFCHGTAGVAHVFNRMYRNTGQELFHETYLHWVDETLKMAKFEDGLAGYKTFHGNEEPENEWLADPGMLEGISGIGLALLAAVSETEPVWDKYFLLS